jgi:NhaP-type Na+/H+ or K+/H+ antiporter
LNGSVHIAIWLVSLVPAIIAVSGICRRFDLSAPVTLIAVGIVASYLPFVPEVHLSSEVVLIGLLPPLLYSAALQTSLVDFNANRRAILLAIGLVAFTALGVGVVLHWVLPGLSWPAAVAFGALVAPPDAVAATAVARRIGLPRRIVSILEGESLHLHRRLIRRVRPETPLEPQSPRRKMPKSDTTGTRFVLINPQGIASENQRGPRARGFPLQ